MKAPDKNKKYIHSEGGVWEIWDGEDFSDDTVLLYNTETGEDISVELAKFHKYFTVIS